MSVLCIGSVSFDSISTSFGSVDEVVGGSATYFSISASFFDDVAVVSAVGEDFVDEKFKVFQEKGIDTRMIQKLKGKTFRWKVHYEDNPNEAKTLDTQLNVFSQFKPSIHPSYRDVDYVFLGNIDPELQIKVLDMIDNPRVVGLDTMNFWIRNKPRELEQALSRADILFVNEEEARILSGEHNAVKVAKNLVKFGPRILVIKRGEYGALLFSEDEFFVAPAFPVEDVYDPTGAGDSFAGGFMGYIAGMGDSAKSTLRRALVYGLTMGSFAIESFSIDALKRLTFPVIKERHQDLIKMIKVED